MTYYLSKSGLIVVLLRLLVRVVKQRLKQKIIIQNEWSVPYNKVLDRTPLHIRKKWEILQNNNDNGSPVVIMCIEWKKNYYLLNFFLDNGLKKTTTTFIFFGWSFSSTGKTDVNICTNKYYYVTYIYTNHHLFLARITDDDSHQQSSFGSGTFGILQICQLFAKYVNEHGTNDHKYIKCTWLLVSSHGPDHLCKESL